MINLARNSKADARLIAAAPMLLCMLKRLLSEVESAPNSVCLITLEQTRNVIAKAEGSK